MTPKPLVFPDIDERSAKQADLAGLLREIGSTLAKASLRPADWERCRQDITQLAKHHADLKNGPVAVALPYGVVVKAAHRHGRRCIMAARASRVVTAGPFGLRRGWGQSAR